MNKYFAMLIGCLLLAGTQTSHAQTGWGLWKGSSYGYEGHSIHLSYRPQPREFRDPQTGVNLDPEVLPVVLGYTRTLNDRHQISIEAGGMRQFGVIITDTAGMFIDAVNSITPQVRAGYRLAPLGAEYFIDPYFGLGLAGGVSFINLPGDVFQGANVEVQALAGIRLFPVEGLFFQLELPYTWANVRTERFPDGSSSFSALFGPDFDIGQFWPLFGLGFQW